MAGAVRFRQTQVPRQPGEIGRLKVVQGPDQGSVYVITAPRVSIGRGEENDVILTDLKASRKHAEVIAAQAGWALRDLGSANGVLHNGTPTRSTLLRTNDTIALGETVLEFQGTEVGTLMLMAPPRTPAEIDARNHAMAHQGFQNRQAMGLGGGGFAARVAENPRPYLVGAALAALLVVLSNGSQPPHFNAVGMNQDGTRGLAQYLPQAADLGGASKTVDQLFKVGFREFMEGHYGRARTQFETVLQVSPGHPLATLYLENCNKAIEDEVKSHAEFGRKAMDSGKLKEAKGHFEAIERLLYRDRSNPAFVEADEQLKKVITQLNDNGGGPS